MNQAVSTLRKLIVLCIGLPLLVAGLALMILPGPGLLVVAIALLVLAIEFPSAKYVLQRGKKKIESLKDR